MKKIVVIAAMATAIAGAGFGIYKWLSRKKDTVETEQATAKRARAWRWFHKMDRKEETEDE